MYPYTYPHIDHDKRSSYAERTGAALVPPGARFTPEQLARASRRGTLDCAPPPFHFDMPSYWEKDERPFAIVFQPYDHGFREIHRQDLTKWCESLDLQWRMNMEDAWREGDNVIFVEITRKAQ